MIGTQMEYNLFFNNCHKFTGRCLTGRSDNRFNYFGPLEEEVFKMLSGNNWRVWGRLYRTVSPFNH